MTSTCEETTTVLLAHGSPDPRHASTLGRLRASVAERCGPTHLAFLEHDLPRPAGLAGALSGRVALVPLLITPAYHARVDVPEAAAALGRRGARVETGPALGGHELLVDAVVERLRAAGHDRDTPTLLVAGGSSSGRAAQRLRDLVARYAPGHWRSTTLSAPDTELADGRVVLPFTLAEGVLHDKAAALAAATGSPFVPGGLADTAALPELVHRRAAEASATPAVARLVS